MTAYDANEFGGTTFPDTTAPAGVPEIGSTSGGFFDGLSGLFGEVVDGYVQYSTNENQYELQQQQLDQANTLAQLQLLQAQQGALPTGTNMKAVYLVAGIALFSFLMIFAVKK